LGNTLIFVLWLVRNSYVNPARPRDRVGIHDAMKIPLNDNTAADGSGNMPSEEPTTLNE
jgi:hypothetical protein